MHRRVAALFLSLLLMFCCSKQPTEVVTWQPKHPKVRQSIKITFTPQRLISSDQKNTQIYLIHQCLTEKEVKSSRIPMTAKGKSWQAEVSCDPGTLLLRLKFEDSLDRVEDNDGFGWNIILRDSANNVPKNAHHKLGVIYAQKKPLSLVSKEDEAYREFQAELAIHPDNYQCWFDLWNLRLKRSQQPQADSAAITAQLDSLLQSRPSSPTLLWLAFEVHSKLLNNPKTAIEYGQKLLAMGENIAQKDAIEYGMIMLTSEQSPQRFIEALMHFCQHAKEPDYLKPAYYQLGLFFQNLQMEDQAIHFFSKYLDLAPDEIPIWLNLANLHLRRQNYEQARQVIQHAQSLNTAENYFLSHSWEEPEERATQLRLNHCQILSTLANLETGLRNYQRAIQSRHQALALGSPFPAFEWTKIGDLFLQLGNLDSAQLAYVKAIAFNPNQDEAIQKLKHIYRTIYGKISGFEDFLAEAMFREQRSSAKPALDFTATDIHGTQHRLSEHIGRVIILTFWDSWSSACHKEIPELNQLAEKYQANDRVVFWAFSVEPQIAIERFIRENPFQFILFPDAIAIKRLYQVIGVPTHIIIDASGKIRFTHIGYSDAIGKQLDDEIQSLLSEAKPIS